ncbi:hypothetical protein N7528_009373 [Penicillium herquei]|nr:hypothetical protein N7528_009373 [Penicillium herquei]
MPPSLLLLIYKEELDSFTLQNFPGLPIADPTVFRHGDPEIPPDLVIALAGDISDNSSGEWTAFEGFKLSMAWQATMHFWYVILKKDNGSRASPVSSAWDAPKTIILGNTFARQQAAESFRDADFGWSDPAEPRSIQDQTPATSEGSVLRQASSNLSNHDDDSKASMDDGAGVDNGDDWDVGYVVDRERRESSTSWNSGQWVTRRDSLDWSRSPRRTESNYSAADENDNRPASIEWW